MFPFINDATLQKDSYKEFKVKEAKQAAKAKSINKWAPSPPEVREAQEAAYREEYGADYIEDRPATMQEARDCLNRLKAKP